MVGELDKAQHFFCKEPRTALPRPNQHPSTPPTQPHPHARTARAPRQVSIRAPAVLAFHFRAGGWWDEGAGPAVAE